MWRTIALLSLTLMSAGAIANDITAALPRGGTGRRCDVQARPGALPLHPVTRTRAPHDGAMPQAPLPGV